MKEIIKQLNKIKETWGIKAFEEILDYYYTLYRKIEQLTESRNKWKLKYMKLKSR